MTRPPAAGPARDRHARVLAYELRRVDQAPRNMPYAAPRSTETARTAGGLVTYAKRSADRSA